MELTMEQQQEAARQERLNEPGTEPPCPLCQRPRVKRSDYIRCNRCGLNWTNGEQAIDRHPLATQPTKPTTPESRDNGAPTVKSISEL
jgi:ribosomal protein L37AE/L43A